MREAIQSVVLTAVRNVSDKITNWITSHTYILPANILALAMTGWSTANIQFSTGWNTSIHWSTKAMMSKIQRFLRKLLDFFYPPTAVCIACGALRVDELHVQLCARCADDLHPRSAPFCPRCGKAGWSMECPECALIKPDALDSRCAAFLYQGTARKLVQALKYESVSAASRSLAEGMMQVLPEEPFDAIVPVPLHRVRQKQRGFNQAELLGGALSALCDIPMCNALSRTRATPSQTQFSKEERAANVQAAFTVGMPVEGLSFLLLDDVLTTSSTANACAEALKAAGAAKVVMIAAAQAGIGEDG